MSGFLRGNAGAVPAEFANLTGRTLAQLQAGVTLAQAEVGEVEVIRDVVITQTVPRPWRLRAGATPILSGNGSMRLTGEEPIFPGSPLTLDTQMQALINRLTLFNATSPHVNASIPTLFSGERRAVLGGTGVQVSSPVFTAVPHFACIGADGNFYYSAQAQSSGNTLWRRAGGPTGAETTVHTNFNLCCYDGARYIYMISPGNIREFDTQTGTLGSAVLFSGAQSTFQIQTEYVSHAAALDRYVVLRTDSPTNYQLYLINAQTGANVLIPGSAGGASRTPVGLNRRSDGQYVATGVNGGNAARFLLGTNLAAPVFSTISPTISISGYSGNYNAFLPLASARNLLVYFVGGTSGHAIYDLDTESFLGSGWDSSPIYSTTTSSWMLRPVDAAQVSTDFGTTDVRVTGERVRV